MVIHEATAKKAYELWEQRGRIPGHDFDNWIEAERIVKAKGKEKDPEGKDSHKNGPGMSGGRKNKSGGLRKKRRLKEGVKPF